MRFRLDIECDNAAFAPPNDDAREPEIFAAASLEIRRILARLTADVNGAERSGFVRDHNGNRCGQWSLYEE